MATLRDLLGDRIISEKKYYDKQQRHKNTTFTCLCPVKDCKNNIKIGNKARINSLCRTCSAKQPKHKIKHKWKLHTQDIRAVKSKIAYPKHFLQEEVRDDGLSYRIYYVCQQCNQRKTLNNTCRKCANLNRRKRPYERTYNRLLVSAKKRKLSVTISYSEFKALCEIDNCHYCTKKLNRARFKSESGTDGVLLDRKDSNLGYSLQNCVSCCGQCNDMKGHLVTYEEMMLIWSMRLENNSRGSRNLGGR